MTVASKRSPDPASADSDGGTYVLLVELSEPATIEFGAAGVYELDAGWYAYVGSAFGTGGLSRVDRHRELAAGSRTTRHWHVDYLLGHPAAELRDVVTGVGRDAECETASVLCSRGQVRSLGASDCSCPGHLVSGSSKRALAGAARTVLGGD